MTAILSCTALDAGYSRRPVVRDLNLGVHPGEIVAILGSTGAGKTTSLLTMAAVSRRVREFGTLKALGWRSGRIIGQVMGESVAVGIIVSRAAANFGVPAVALLDLPIESYAADDCPQCAAGEPITEPGSRFLR